MALVCLCHFRDVLFEHLQLVADGIKYTKTALMLVPGCRGKIIRTSPDFEFNINGASGFTHSNLLKCVQEGLTCLQLLIMIFYLQNYEY